MHHLNSHCKGPQVDYADLISARRGQSYVERAAVVDDIVMAMADDGRPLSTEEVAGALGVRMATVLMLRDIKEQAPDFWAAILNDEMSLIDAFMAIVTAKAAPAANS